jgi:hypothetical protein
VSSRCLCVPFPRCRTGHLTSIIYSKQSYRDSKARSGSFLLSNNPKKSPVPRTPSQQKSGHESLTSMHITDMPAAGASSSSSSNRPIFNSTSHSYQTSHINASGLLVYTEVDLLNMGAWINPRQILKCYTDTLYQTSNSTHPSACQYHTSVMGVYYNTAGSGYGLAPFERWLNEGVGDGGSMVLQLGQKLGVKCTCIEVQSGMEVCNARYN